MNCFSIVLLVRLASFQIDSPIDDAVKNELQQFQGNWKAAALINTDGRSATAEELEQTQLFVEGNKFTLKGKGFTIKGQFTVDPAKMPKTIDVTLDTKEGDQPVKVLGIYRISGETRKSCFALPDKPRPKDFPTSRKEYLQFEWRR